jgi:hypothetical protein
MGRQFVLACALLSGPLAIGVAAGQGADVGDGFPRGVLTDFQALARAAHRRMLDDQGLLEDAETREVRSAFREADQAFRQAVLRYWPYRREAEHNAAARALEAAETFAAEQYRKGRAGRDEAAARYLAVADKFPDTPEHDRALSRAYRLYTSRLAGEAETDPDAAQRIRKRLLEALNAKERRAGPQPGGPPARAGATSRDAEKAFRKAKRFDTETYRAGHASRQEAVARYVDVAEEFPGTPAQDRALLMAATLYTQRRAGRDDPDAEGARGMYARLAARPGPTTSYVLLAEENLASVDPNPAIRMKARSDHYHTLSGRWADRPFATELLTPSSDISPEQFARRVSETLLTLGAVQRTTAANMTADAVHTPQPLDALLWLRKRHQGDKLVDSQLEKAIAHVRRSGLEQERVHDIDAMAIKEIQAQPIDTNATEDRQAAPSTSATEADHATPAARETAPPGPPLPSRPARDAPGSSRAWLLAGSALCALAGIALAAVLLASRRRSRP